MSETESATPGAPPRSAAEMADEQSKWCPACQVQAYYDAVVLTCQLCEGPLEDLHEELSEDTLQLRLTFRLVECESCRQATPVRIDHRCTRCGEPLPADFADVPLDARRVFFKGGIARLVATAEAARISDPAFTKKDSSVDPAAYVESVFWPGSNDVLAALRDVKAEARVTQWDALDGETRAGFTRAAGAMRRAIASVERLAAVLPPYQYRGAHRILTRSLGALVAGHLEILTALAAADIVEVQQRQADGQRLLDDATRTVNYLSERVDLFLQPRQNDWWLTGKVIDAAAVAWTGVKQQPSSIADAAAGVRRALAGVPGVDDLDDAFALQLLPAAVLPVPFVDALLVRRRAVAVRALLDAADRDVPGWISDKRELVERIADAVRAVHREIRLLASVSADREGSAHLLASTYKRMVEGPLRTLGAIVVIAARASRGEANGTYRHETARAVQAGEVIQELGRSGPDWTGVVEMVLRNADAHGDVDVLDSGMSFTQVTSKDGTVIKEKTITLTDAEFAEVLATLEEAVLALQLAVLPWLGGSSDPDIVAARAAVAETRDETEAGIRLLAGIQGLAEVTFSMAETTLTVAARPAGFDVDVRSAGIASMLPGLFHGWPECTQVVVTIATREPVTFARTEIEVYANTEGAERLAAVGLIQRRWMGALDGARATLADITWLCLPHLDAVDAAFAEIAEHAAQPMVIKAAADSLARVSVRLQRTNLPTPQSSLVSDVRNLLADAARHSGLLARATLRKDRRQTGEEAGRCQEIAALVVAVRRRIGVIQAELRGKHE